MNSSQRINDGSAPHLPQWPAIIQEADGSVLVKGSHPTDFRRQVILGLLFLSMIPWIYGAFKLGWYVHQNIVPWDWRENYHFNMGYILLMILVWLFTPLMLMNFVIIPLLWLPVLGKTTKVWFTLDAVIIRTPLGLKKQRLPRRQGLSVAFRTDAHPLHTVKANSSSPFARAWYSDSRSVQMIYGNNVIRLAILPSPRRAESFAMACTVANGLVLGIESISVESDLTTQNLE